MRFNVSARFLCKIGVAAAAVILARFLGTFSDNIIIYGGLSNFFNFLKIGKSYSSNVLGLLVFILWPHFRKFSCIYTSLTKSYEHFVTSTRMFSNIFNFLLTSAFSYIHCCNFFISTASCYILFVYFLRRKEVHPGF